MEYVSIIVCPTMKLQNKYTRSYLPWQRHSFFSFAAPQVQRPKVRAASLLSEQSEESVTSIGRRNALLWCLPENRLMLHAQNASITSIAPLSASFCTRSVVSMAFRAKDMMKFAVLRSDMPTSVCSSSFTHVSMDICKSNIRYLTTIQE